MNPLILVANNDTAYSRNLRMWLLKAGYRVFQTFTSADTIRTLRGLQIKPDVVVIDVHLDACLNPANESGFLAAEVAKQLRIPVVMTYLTTTPAAKARALEGSRPLALAYLLREGLPTSILEAVAKALALNN